MRVLRFTVLICFLISWAASAYAGAAGREENYIVANGQGVSSPSFWQGISGQNPAANATNRSLKIQAGAAAFGNTISNPKFSGALLGGLGPVGGGIEYSQYNRLALASGQSQINAGLGLSLPVVSTSLGLSVHAVSGGAESIDVGILHNVFYRFRLGLMATDVTHNLKRFAGGLSFYLDSLIDVVVDADLNTQNKAGTIKPGLSLHLSQIHLTGAYGVRYRGNSDEILSEKFTGAVGLELSRSCFLQYQYQMLSRHLLGLTLRLN